MLLAVTAGAWDTDASKEMIAALVKRLRQATVKAGEAVRMIHHAPPSAAVSRRVQSGPVQRGTLPLLWATANVLSLCDSTATSGHTACRTVAAQRTCECHPLLRTFEKKVDEAAATSNHPRILWSGCPMAQLGAPQCS